MRVRGLKPRAMYDYQFGKESHPMRVRGLKLNLNNMQYQQDVAPHAGAWIETNNLSLSH